MTMVERLEIDDGRPQGYGRKRSHGAANPDCRSTGMSGTTCCKCPVLIHTLAPTAPATATSLEPFGNLNHECRANVSPPSLKSPSSTKASNPPGRSSAI